MAGGPCAGRRVGGERLFGLINRADFDAELVAAAVREGAQLRTGVVVTGLDDDPTAPDASGVSLQIRGAPSVRARVVIGADGSASRLGKYVGVVAGPG